MSVNSLGPFTFIRMDAVGRPHGMPPLLKTGTALAQRPGVPGTGVIDLARRGNPFPLATVVDVATNAAGENLRRLYSEAIATDALALVRAGYNYSELHGVKYIITDLQDDAVQPTLNAIGGLNNGRFLVIATFVLLPVEA